MDGQAAVDVNNSVQVILPLVVVAGGALLVLLADLFLGQRHKGLLAWLAAGVLVTAMAVAAGQWVRFNGGLRFAERGPETGFAGMVTLDKYGLFFVFLFGAAGLLTIMLSDAYLAARKAPRGEFYVLLLLVLAGMIGMATSTDLVSLFVSFELMSLPTYVLAGYNKRELRSGEASLKYFINGAFSSAVLLFGFAILYAVSGATTFAEISAGLDKPLLGDGAVVVALVFIATGFGFKIAAVPFHGWAPDTYQGAPTPVTTFMSVGVKAAAFAGLLRLFVAAVMPAWEVWSPILIILAVITMIVGNVLALPQRDLKRLLAYSSIAHAGYLLLGVIAVGSSDTAFGSSAVLVYLVAYTFMNVGAFGMLVYLRNRRPFRYQLDELRGLGRSSPAAALALTLFMLSLTGIPPTAGFWGKFYLFSAVVDAGYTWLAILAVIMSAVSAFYYLRVVWFMYFEQPTTEAGAAAAPAEAAGDGAGVRSDGPSPAPGETPSGVLLPETDTGSGAAMLVASLGVLFIGLWPQGLLWAAQGAVQLISGG